uniref:ZnMc domain-containing protein n=1 Tax=Steinernema glaseri TaxID=37863 RepID=A0A1I7ZHM7_9BILA
MEANRIRRNREGRQGYNAKNGGSFTNGIEHTNKQIRARFRSTRTENSGNQMRGRNVRKIHKSERLKSAEEEEEAGDEAAATRENTAGRRRKEGKFGRRRTFRVSEAPSESHGGESREALLRAESMKKARKQTFADSDYRTLSCCIQALRHTGPAGLLRLRYGDPYGTLPGKTLCYRISRYPRPELHRRLPPTVLRKYAENALLYAVKVWQQAIAVKFEPCGSARRADLDVVFATFYHGDEYPFDGVGNEVAHAFFPSHRERRGQIHIDDNEPWGPSRGRNLFWVLAHELGHSLGLDHAPPGVDSIMTAQYRGYETSLPRLFPYDYRRIQAKYDAPEENSVVEELPVPGELRESNPADLCSGEGLDTIFTLPDGNLYVARADLYWVLSTNHSQIAGFPKRLSELFGPSISGPLDAIFTDRFDWTWVVKGNQAWKVDASGEQIVVGGPTPLREASPFSNLAHSGVGTVLAINAQQSTQPSVFFLGNKYWVDDNYDGSSDDNTEHDLAEVLGPSEAPQRIDAAVWLPFGGSFVFSGSKFWKVELERRTLKALPGYPRSIATFLGC